MANESGTRSQSMQVDEDVINMDYILTKIGSADTKPRCIGANEEESE